MTLQDWQVDLEATLTEQARENLEDLKQLNTDEAGEPVCDCCRNYHPQAALTYCHTAYADPALNTKPFLCPPCTEAYHDHWAERWEDYYSGLL